MHIAFAASECVPFSKTGGLADVVGALPRALAALGHQVSVYVPRYRQSKLPDPQTVQIIRKMKEDRSAKIIEIWAKDSKSPLMEKATRITTLLRAAVQPSETAQ